MITITKTDGDTATFSVKNGSKGDAGIDGESITITNISMSSADAGSNVITFSDGKSITIKNGGKGSAGVDGIDGTSVTVSNVSESTTDGGSNVIAFSDGKTITIKNGSKGSNGADGLSIYTSNDSPDVSPDEYLEYYPYQINGAQNVKEGDLIYSTADNNIYQVTLVASVITVMSLGCIKGDPGSSGKTPIKGTDYFTADDKAEMAEQAAELVEIPDIGGLFTFNGKKVMFFGDSITYGSDQYVPKLLEYTGMVNVGNHAQNGAKLYHSTSKMTTESATKDTVPGQVQLLLDDLALYDVPDIIIVSAGTNGSTPDSDYDETQYTNDAGEYIDFACVDLHTYSGAMRWIYEKLNTCYPLAKIFFATPLQVYGGSARTYGDLRARAECIRQNCQRLATPCIDAFFKSGIYGRYERSSAQGRYLKDGLHLNANGAIILANCYLKEISNAMVDRIDVPNIQPDNDPELKAPAAAYTNQVPISIDTDGSVFNGVGYQNGYRISTSSGNASVESNSTISGYIPATNGDVIRVYGVDWYNPDGTKNTIAAYDSDFAYIGATYGNFRGTTNYPLEYCAVVNDHDVRVAIRSADALGKTVAYIRVNSLGLGVATDGANMIVTVNEEIL